MAEPTGLGSAALLQATAASRRPRDRTLTSGSGTEPAAPMSESRDRTASDKPSERAAKASSLGPLTCHPETSAWTRYFKRYIKRADAKEDMRLRNSI